MTTKYNPIPSDIGDYLSYDPCTGIVFWINSTSRMKAHIGRSWGTSHQGCLRGAFRGVSYRVHRVAWFLQTGQDLRNLTPDHVDGDGTNNRWENLRLATSSSDQSRNLGALGYSWNSRDDYFKAKIWDGKKDVHLGNYRCPLLARIAYHTAAKEYFPSTPFVPRKEIKGRPAPLASKRLGYAVYSSNAFTSALVVQVCRNGKLVHRSSHACPLLARLSYCDARAEVDGCPPLTFVPSCEIKGNPHVRSLAGDAEITAGACP